MKKYKYLVVIGCSQSYGQHCPQDKIYVQLLADKLGLTLVNLSTPSAGWYSVETNVTSFINNNRSILDECFFILQKSTLDRRVNYSEIATCKTNVWNKWNINYLSPINFIHHGCMDEALTINDVMTHKFPEHKLHINNKQVLINFKENKLLIQEQFEELMLHWAVRIHSLHLFLRHLDVDHIIVDGYSPFVSYKLNFTNYYDTNYEYEMVKLFWSTDSMYVNTELEIIYDFRNIKAGWIFDSIDIQYKIDDVILYDLYRFKSIKGAVDDSWNIDGGHAGPLGMKLIADVIYKNLVTKGWFKESV